MAADPEKSIRLSRTIMDSIQPKALNKMLVACLLFAAIAANSKACSEQTTADEKWLMRLGVKASREAIRTDADREWVELLEILRMTDDSAGKPDDEQLAALAKGRGVTQLLIEQRFRGYRDRGRVFWRKYPDDPRRLFWLVTSVIYSPMYVKDEQEALRAFERGQDHLVEIDKIARSQWDSEYIRMRSEFLADVRLTNKDRDYFRAVELADVRDDLLMATRRGEDVDGNYLANRFLGLVLGPATYHDWPQGGRVGLARSIFQLLEKNREAQKAFVQSLHMSEYAELKAAATGLEQLAALGRNPIDLKLVAFDGTAIRLADFRGKVLLVEVWGLGCKSCIEQMPKLETIYKKYRDFGFEIVGLWQAPYIKEDVASPSAASLEYVATAEARAKEILERQGVSWLNTRMTDPGEIERFNERYCITYVPTMWLFDQSGRLVTTDVGGARLEHMVSKLLGRAE